MTMTIAKLSFWKATAERTIGTVAATAAALAVGGAATENLPIALPGVVDVDWLGIASISVTAGVVTILKAVAATKTGPGPSLTNTETIKE